MGSSALDTEALCCPGARGGERMSESQAHGPGHGVDFNLPYDGKPQRQDDRVWSGKIPQAAVQKTQGQGWRTEADWGDGHVLKLERLQLHNTVNVLNTTRLLASQWSKWSISCYVYFTTKIKNRCRESSSRPEDLQMMTRTLPEGWLWWAIKAVTFGICLGG